MMKKSNIEWCDFTWDPVTGCRNDCSFCESRKRLSHFKGDIRFHLSDERIHIDEERSLYVITTPLAKNGSSVPAPTGFYPTLHPYRLQQVIQKIKPANIWVCHSGDLFGEWIPTEWILQVFEAAKQAPWHNYMFLTMNPNRYEELLETGVLMPTDNFWYGTRLTERGNVFTADGYHTFLCIEPMRLFAERMEIPNVEWILLGGYGKLKRSWIESVMERKGNIPVFMIGSKLFKDVWRAPLIQEYPPLLYRPAEKTLPHCSEFNYTLEKNITIDALVNNAGFGDFGNFWEVDAQRQTDLLQVNIMTLVQLTRYFLPGMVERRHGSVLNLSSVAAFSAGPRMCLYYASKEFVRSFSEAVAEEVRSTGVTVTALCPGPTATGFEQAAQMKNSHMFSMFKPASAAAVAEAGFRAAQKGKTLRYCGWPTHTVSIAARLLPRSVCRRFMMKVNG